MNNRASGNDRVALQVGSIGHNHRDRNPHSETPTVDVDNVNTREATPRSASRPTAWTGA